MKNLQQFSSSHDLKQLQADLADTRGCLIEVIGIGTIAFSAACAAFVKVYKTRAEVYKHHTEAEKYKAQLKELREKEQPGDHYFEEPRQAEPRIRSTVPVKHENMKEKGWTQLADDPLTDLSIKACLWNSSVKL